MNHRMSPAQAARQLGVGRDFVVALIEAGELPATDEHAPGVSRKRYRIDPDDLVRWRESRSLSGDRRESSECWRSVALRRSSRVGSGA